MGCQSGVVRLCVSFCVLSVFWASARLYYLFSRVFRGRGFSYVLGVGVGRAGFSYFSKVSRQNEDQLHRTYIQKKHNNRNVDTGFMVWITGGRLAVVADNLYQEVGQGCRLMVDRCDGTSGGAAEAGAEWHQWQSRSRTTLRKVQKERTFTQQKENCALKTETVICVYATTENVNTENDLTRRRRPRGCKYSRVVWDTHKVVPQNR